MFDRIKNQAQDKAAGVADAAQEKLEEVIDQFNQFLPIAEELGLSLETFHIEAGILPELNATLIGSVDRINNETVDRIISENENNKILVAALKAVLMAKSVHEKLEGVYISILQDLVIDMKLGIPPSISCKFKKPG
ncbi:hypothetical protein PJF56_02050 [Roseofilum sp. BLCC_M91]|uniref:Uncharacterized protein n=1 Tax=Roseofilum halophilum BLCC-M91 TaxID=3022259 RepID=A0ABT7BFR0_9CYAN|nr:hypothetical protein [Roseofilum halophilum]MDJ1177637.1 hypothetical protein [Roseofilum halophilum BLCC-M91]